MPRSLMTHIDTPARVGERLRAARLDAGLSQRGLAFKGCTAAYISRLEAGARVASLQMITELARRLNVSTEWLATGINPSPDDVGIALEILERRVAVLERQLVKVAELGLEIVNEVARVGALTGPSDS